MTVDLERLRRGVTNARNGVRYGPGEPMAALTIDELEALLAVVDEGREYVRLTRGRDVLNPCEWARLFRALEPFTPPADRAWEEVDRWNAKQATTEKRDAFARLMDVDESHNPAPTRTIEFPANAKPNTFGNPRDRARDQLADAGVAVQRQFRSDQERIAELERERDALRKERDARRADVRELETDAAATAGELGEYEELVEKLKRELADARREARKRHGWQIEQAQKRAEAEARLSRVPALVAAVEHEAYWLEQLATGPWGQGEFTDEPSRLAVQVRHENVAKHARAILAALAEWEKP